MVNDHIHNPPRQLPPLVETNDDDWEYQAPEGKPVNTNAITAEPHTPEWYEQAWKGAIATNRKWVETHQRLLAENADLKKRIDELELPDAEPPERLTIRSLNDRNAALKSALEALQQTVQDLEAERDKLKTEHDDREQLRQRIQRLEAAATAREQVAVATADHAPLSVVQDNLHLPERRADADSALAIHYKERGRPDSIQWFLQDGNLSRVVLFPPLRQRKARMTPCEADVIIYGEPSHQQAALGPHPPPEWYAIPNPRRDASNARIWSAMEDAYNSLKGADDESA